MTDTAQSTGADWRELKEHLSALKEAGAAFLVTGSVPTEIRAEHCRQAMGEDSTDPRRRLLVLTDQPNAAASTRLPTATHPQSETILINHTVFSRTATTPADTIEQSSVTERRVTADQMSDIGQTVIDAVDDLQSGLPDSHSSSSTVRVCVDSIAPYTTEYGPETVFEFLHLLIHFVTDAAGMLHVYLPKPRQHELTEIYAPIFDGVITLRVDGGGYQQQWDLRDGPKTGWITP